MPATGWSAMTRWIRCLGRVDRLTAGRQHSTVATRDGDRGAVAICGGRSERAARKDERQRQEHKSEVYVTAAAACDSWDSGETQSERTGV
jgi:hypothetical protein